MPPIGAKFDNLLFQMRLEDELKGAFSGFSFVVTTDGPNPFDNFMLIPMLPGKAGGNVTEALAAYSDLEIVETIASFLRRYLGETSGWLN
ncbi:hypothetical protein AB6802_13160 [Mesorhizobium sp. RCC_202]|uniref:hypothetical protein n=1 Tax=Mesorhizobium sp. RCC_202 TaxID=3239222 RepID=UPI003524BFEB